MRPERDNIGAPDLPPDIVWIGEKPSSMPALTAAGPVLVHFFDYSQLNGVRTLPYLIEWDRRYREAGLTTIGVQAPRFPFGSDPVNVAAGMRDLGVELPVAIDAERGLWHAYGCEGWPSLFLWSAGGALSWFHFGEGEYLATEEAIQEELRQLDALQSLPEPMEALRATDAPGVEVMPPTPELFPGGSWEQPWEGGQLELDYEAGGAFATIEGEGTLTVIVDGSEPHQLQINGARLYELTEHARHQAHHLKLEPSEGLRIWSVSFAPGIP
ncbi:MAG TPA: hypothetical protein VID51_02005 [Solirubrobacterales bacterium]|jgi:hypothetical protein